MINRRELKNDSCRFLLLTLFLLCAPGLSAHGVTRYENGSWFDGRTFVQKSWYSVDGKLQERFEGKPDSVVDLTGRFVVPPLAEGHTHDFSTGSNLDRDVRRYLTNGVFYARNMNSIIRLSQPIRARLRGAETVDVAWANAGITASGGHPIQIYASVATGIPGWKPSEMEGEAYFVVDSEQDLAKKWPAIIASSPDFLKTYLETSEEHAVRKSDESFYGRRGLDPKILGLIVKRAGAAGLRVSVHVTTAADFRAAIRAGANEIAHLPLERLTPEDARAAGEARVTVVTTTLSHRPTNGIEDLDRIHAHNLSLLYEAGVRLSIGTDSGRSVRDELINVARLLPVSRAELLRIAGETAAEIFPGRRVGRLAAGYEASFIVLDKNPIEDLANLNTISMRVKQGHLLQIVPDKPQIGELLIPLIMKDGVKAALERYEQLRAAGPLTHDDSEAAFNALGYGLMAHDRLDDAILIFTMNTSRHPDSANAWDSLGEAWMKKGDRARAIEYYRKSLDLNPRNTNAKEKLVELAADSP